MIPEGALKCYQGYVDVDIQANSHQMVVSYIVTAVENLECLRYHIFGER